MALMTLLLLTTLMLAFTTLAQTEPLIAVNHLRATQAVALAESGIEYAVWALTHATTAGGVGGSGASPNTTIVAPAVAPFDGSQRIDIGTAGGVQLTITGADQNLRVVRAVGVSPTSRAEVLATLVRVRNVARDAACALCTGAATTLVGSVIDARGSDPTDCGTKTGIDSTAGVTLAAGTQVFGTGAAPDATQSQEGRDWRASQSPTAFLTTDDLLTLKSLAIGRGTYMRPPSDARVALTGIADGLVFVDTPSGSSVLSSTNVANVAIGPSFAASGSFRGWLVVNGNVILEAGADVDGLVYAANTIVTEGPASIDGLVIARQVLGTGSLTLADLRVRFDCAAARGHGQLPLGWFVRTGTYCDGTAGC